ncbi:shikimate kinase [Escherichia coli]
MQNNGIVVYLCAPVSVLVNRLQVAPEEDLRPTLTGKTAERRSSGSAGRARCAISRSCAYYH